MKILLLNPPNLHREGDDFYVTFPLGIAYVAAYLENTRHQVFVLDSLAGCTELKPNGDGQFRVGLSDGEILNHIKQINPDLIGISCSYTVQYPISRHIANMLKAELAVPVVLGGAHGSALPKQVLQDGVFDYVVIGEGEETLLHLANCIENEGRGITDIRGLGFRVDDRFVLNPKQPLERVDELPLPARHLFSMENYIWSEHSHNSTVLKKPYTTMITSRGCPLKCTFCSVHTIWGHNNRKRSALRTVDEIQHLRDTYSIREIHFEDDMLTLDRPRIMDICREIVSRKLNISWATPNGVFVNTLNRELLSAMKSSGCYQLALAIESGNKRVLRDLMNKNVSLDRARSVVKEMRDLDMGVYFFFILGTPGETAEDILDTIEFAKELAPDEAYFSIATPYPGTELYRMCKERGYIEENLDLTRLRPTQAVIDTEFLSSSELMELRDFAYQEWSAVKNNRTAGANKHCSAITRRIPTNEECETN